MRPLWATLSIVSLAACGGDAGGGERGLDGGLATRDADVVDRDGGADAGPPDGGLEDLPPPEHLWFKLNGSGRDDTMLDESVNEAHAILTGTYTWTGSSIVFGAADSGAQTPELPGSYRSVPHTISAWVTPAERSDRTLNDFAQTPFPSNVVSNDVPSLDGFGFGINVWTDGGGGSAMRLGAVGNVPDLTFEAGTRYHVVVVYTAADVTLYLDGEEAYVGGPPGTLAEIPSPVYIGRHNNDANYGSKRFFVGEVDDVRVYRRALEADDVAVLFALDPA